MEERVAAGSRSILLRLSPEQNAGRSILSSVSALLARNGLAVFFGALIVLLAILRPQFLGSANLLSILKGASVIGIIACGMTVVMVVGGFDLSVARVTAMTGVLVVMLQDLGPIPAVLLTLLAAVAIGLLDGMLIVKAKVNPFVVTLGMMSIAGAGALLLSGGNVLYHLAPWLKWISQGYVGPLPKVVVWFLSTVIVTHVVLAHTHFGRYVFATGGNYEASRLAGIRVDRITATSYVLVSFLSGVAGIVLASRLDSGSPIALPGGELDAIAAVIIGGTKLGGGEGSIFPGTLIGVLILSCLNNGMILLGIDPYWQGVAKGSVIIIAVAFDVFQRRWSRS